MRTIRWSAVLATGVALGAAAAGADKKPEELLARYRALATANESLTAEISLTIGDSNPKAQAKFEAAGLASRKGTARLMRPSYALIKLGVRTYASDGKNLYWVYEDQKRYAQRELPRRGETELWGLDATAQVAGLGLNPLNGFMRPELAGSAQRAVYTGVRRVGEEDFETVTVSVPAEPPAKRREVLFFNGQGLLVGWESTSSGTVPRGELAGPYVRTTRLWLKDIRLGSAVKPEEFAFTPPPGFTLIGNP